MKSRTVSSIVLAAAALVSVSAFAGDPANSVSGKTRAEVQVELLQAQRQGFNSSGNFKNYPELAVSSTRTRADVQSELLQAKRQGFNASGNFKNYPEVTTSSTRTRAEVRAELASAGSFASNELYSHR